MTPSWVGKVTFGLALAALGVATYLTVAHYTSPHALVCAENGVVNCTRVTTSAQSRFLGAPVAVLGVVWAATMVVLCRPAAWRSRRPSVRIARVGASVLGIASVSYLLYAELVVVRAICLWCTAMHVLVFTLFVLIVLHPEPERVPARR
jgi:Predicted membrane protein